MTETNYEYRLVEYAYGNRTGAAMAIGPDRDPEAARASAESIPKSGRWEIERREVGPWGPVEDTEDPQPKGRKTYMLGRVPGARHLGDHIDIHEDWEILGCSVGSRQTGDYQVDVFVAIPTES